MIYVYLSGGLGNQLFEYACGYCFAKDHGEDLCLITNQLIEDKYRDYRLGCFNIDPKVHIQNYSIFGHNPSSILFKIIRKISLKLSWKVGKLFGNYFWKDSSYMPILNNSLNKNIYLDGYWQSEKYFYKYSSIIKYQFKIKNEYISDKYMYYFKLINKTNAVCVHVRLGDYVGNKIYSICTEEYYQSGIQYIKHIYKDAHFFIFSDEIQKVADFLHCENSTIIDGDLSDVESLSLMSMCKHFIISNSSFSWWAQYLCNNEAKIVFAPHRWSNDGKNIYELKDKRWIIWEGKQI